MSRHIDAALTSGTSPGGRPQRIHLIGPGAVGRALLGRIGTSRHILVAATDSNGTIHNTGGLDATAVARWKQQGRGFAQHADYTLTHWADVIDNVDADIVIDTTPSVPRPAWSATLEATVLESGRNLVLASKTSLAERAAVWLGGRYAGRVGVNAVLGGTGSAFVRAVPALRTHCIGATIVGNASTTSIIDAIESGRSFEDGVQRAQRLGYLEPDPETDLRGTDAAVKLAIVAGAIHGRVFDPSAIPCQDIRTLDPVLLQARARSGRTTRLIARLTEDGGAAVAYEAVPVDSILAAPCGRVIYEYHVRAGSRHIYIGEGLGADATATAAWLDIQTISRNPATSRTAPVEVWV